MHATMEAKAENLRFNSVSRLMWVNGAGGKKGNERKVGKMRREKFMLHIFERYSNETTCKMAATSREKDRKKRKGGEGKTFEKRGS